MKEKIPEKSIIEVLKRSKGRCEDCGLFTEQPVHHVFFKSQYYGKDRNLSWNLVELCEYHHRILHHAGTDEEIRDKRSLDCWLKENALKRYHGNNKSELELIYKRAKIKNESNTKNT